MVEQITNYDEYKQYKENLLKYGWTDEQLDDLFVMDIPLKTFMHLFSCIAVLGICSIPKSDQKTYDELRNNLKCGQYMIFETNSPKNGWIIRSPNTPTYTQLKTNVQKEKTSLENAIKLIKGNNQYMFSPTTFRPKELYKIFGCTKKGCTEEDIKKISRALATQYGLICGNMETAENYYLP